MHLALDARQLHAIAISPGFIALARAIHHTRQHEAATRDIVSGYLRPVFARFAFVCRSTWGGQPAPDAGQPVTDPAQLYRSDQRAMLARYYAACDAAHRAHGYHLEPGFCPALVARHARVTAECDLLHFMHRRSGIDFNAAPDAIRDGVLQLFIGMASTANPHHVLTPATIPQPA